MAQAEDERVGLNLEISKRFGEHTPAIGLSYSTERDYESKSISLKDSIDFNRRNTTLTIGGAYTLDAVKAYYFSSHQRKVSVDMMLGVTQILDKNTYVSLNYTHGVMDGFLTDPYKVVELNGQIVAENRPDHKDKDIIFATFTRYFEPLKASAEVSFRNYSDSSGIGAQTYSFDWYQKIGGKFILSPSIRYYEQTAADYYADRFSGSPRYYSSDFRLSHMSDVGCGLRLIWNPSEQVSLDVGYERFVMTGRDGVTDPDAYPSANIFIIGASICL